MVWAYKRSNLVLKQDFSDSGSYTSPDLAIKSAILTRLDGQGFSSRLEAINSSPGIIVEDNVVVHRHPISNRYIFSRVQTFYQNSLPLSSISISAINRLPDQSLLDLKNIFTLSQKYRSEGLYVDVIGSHTQSKTNAEKFTRGFLSLLWSENIIIDDSSRVRFIDFSLRPNSNSKILSDIRDVGSILILDTILFVRRFRSS